MSSYELNPYLYIFHELEVWAAPVLLSSAMQRSSAGMVVIEEAVVLIGGNQVNKALSDLILYLNSENMAVSLGHLPVAVTGHAVAHAGRNIYVFGGSQTMGSNYLLNVGTSNFYNLTINSTGCSIGSFGEACTMCGPGSYNSNLNGNACDLCIPGTYSNSYGLSYLSQCTPCPYGTFADTAGSTYCKDCDIPNDCPVGSTAAYYSQYIEASSQIQPLAYDSGSSQANYIISTVLYFMLAVIAAAWCLYFALINYNFFRRVDIFSEQHERKYYEEPFRTSLGGVMTLVFLIVASIFIVSPSILYIMANIVETKTLVPVFTLDNQQFYTPVGLIKIQLFNYAGECGDVNLNCIGHITAVAKGVNTPSGYNRCYTLENSCVLAIYCIDCNFEPTSLISITVWDYLVYATAIQIEMGTFSSIPDSNVSSIILYVSAPQGQVFNGLNPTQFSITLFPSVKYT